VQISMYIVLPLVFVSLPFDTRHRDNERSCPN
jgi:hypothetical protein